MDTTETNKEKSNLWGNIINVLLKIVDTILPNHTVIIIIIGIIGYFIFYPTVNHPNLYEALIKSNSYTPFLYFYFTFGLIYLYGGMQLVKDIQIASIQKNKNELEAQKEIIQAETKKMEVENSTINFYEKYRKFEDEMIEYLVNTLGIPEDKIKRNVRLDKRFEFDAVIYDANNNHIALSECKLKQLNKKQIEQNIEQLKKFISSVSSFKGGYLFVSSDKGLEVSFYNSKGEKIDKVPSYEELCKLK